MKEYLPYTNPLILRNSHDKKFLIKDNKIFNVEIFPNLAQYISLKKKAYIKGGRNHCI